MSAYFLKKKRNKKNVSNVLEVNPTQHHHNIPFQAVQKQSSRSKGRVCILSKKKRNKKNVSNIFEVNSHSTPSQFTFPSSPVSLRAMPAYFFKKKERRTLVTFLK